VTIDCPGEEHDDTLTVPATPASVDPELGEWVTTGPVPSGVTCTATMAEVPPWTPVSGTRATVVIPGADLAVEVVFIVKRETAKVALAKEIDGVNDVAESTAFALALDCGSAQYDRRMTLEIPAHGTFSEGNLDGFPVGLRCSVSEPDVPAGWKLVRIDSPTFVVDSGLSGATVINTRVTAPVPPTPKVVQPGVVGALPNTGPGGLPVVLSTGCRARRCGSPLLIEPSSPLRCTGSLGTCSARSGCSCVQKPCVAGTGT
jgi:hypothetical protein